MSFVVLFLAMSTPILLFLVAWASTLTLACGYLALSASFKRWRHWRHQRSRQLTRFRRFFLLIYSEGVHVHPEGWNTEACARLFCCYQVNILTGRPLLELPIPRERYVPAGYDIPPNLRGGDRSTPSKHENSSPS